MKNTEDNLRKEIEKDIENCNTCKCSCYALEIKGRNIFVCKDHFIKWDNYMKGYNLAKAETLKKVFKEIEKEIDKCKDRKLHTCSIGIPFFTDDEHNVCLVCFEKQVLKELTQKIKGKEKENVEM
jgi:hypothetical protein